MARETFGVVRYDQDVMLNTTFRSTFGRFPLEDVLLDLLLIVLVWTALDETIHWMGDHLFVAWLGAGPLHWLAMAAALAGRRGPFGWDGEERPLSPGEEKATGLMGLVLVLGMAGGLWLIWPRMAVEAQRPLPGLCNFYEIGVVFGTIFIFGLFLERPALLTGRAPQGAVRLGTAVLIGGYLFYCEALIAATLPFAGGEALWAGLALLAMVFLPFRMMLLLRPPFSLWEMGTAVLAFAVFLQRILAA